MLIVNPVCLYDCRAVATVEIPSLLAGDIVKVGWIQTCSSLLFVNEYGSLGL